MPGIFRLTSSAPLAAPICSREDSKNFTPGEFLEPQTCCRFELHIFDLLPTLKCCELMRPVMSFTIFIQFLLTGIVLGLTLLYILYFSGLLRGLSSAIFFGNVLFETFPFCYLCDALVDDCAELANLLAQSNWIDAGKKYKSTLKICMQHVQKPIIFVAGGVFPITLNSNIKVAKFAFSVMTIVQQNGSDSAA
ncbi:odorant receptor 59b-like [Drosophila montana]|uniref:odorant receptor 59b-like n=1 Tax=Drosophila montana TaxID=40370 RepID=UPI00313D3DBF